MERDDTGDRRWLDLMSEGGTDYFDFYFQANGGRQADWPSMAMDDELDMWQNDKMMAKNDDVKVSDSGDANTIEKVVSGGVEGGNWGMDIEGVGIEEGSGVEGGSGIAGLLETNNGNEQDGTREIEDDEDTQDDEDNYDNPSACEPIVIKVTREAQDEIISTYAGHEGEEVSGVLEDNNYCNCIKTKCVKMYCICFRKGLPCGSHCNCRDCENTPGNHESNKLHRQHRLSNGASYYFSSASELFCSCRSNFCEKAYCPCLKNQRPCTSKCRCFHCKNIHGSRQ